MRSRHSQGLLKQEEPQPRFHDLLMCRERREVDDEGPHHGTPGLRPHHRGPTMVGNQGPANSHGEKIRTAMRLVKGNGPLEPSDLRTKRKRLLIVKA